MSGELTIGTLSGRVELEDKMSSTLDLLVEKVSKFDERFGGLGTHIAEQAAGFLTAEVAWESLKEGFRAGIEVIEELSVEGSKIAGVEQNFERLTETTGRLGATLLGSLQEGTRNTVANFELMKTANQDLAAGMNLTDTQFGTLSKSAFALAKATGGDVKDAMETVNSAMLTGRTRAIALLTGRIDLAKAEQDFASNLNTTADRLTAEGKLEADRQAIMEKLSEATGRLGEQQLSLGDKIEQAKTQWKNWYEELAVSVATSPNVVAAFDAIKGAIMGAVGDTADLREKIVGWINDLADKVTTYGPQVITWFVGMKDRVVELYHEVIDTWTALPEWLKTVAALSVEAGAGLYVVNAAAVVAGGGIHELVSGVSSALQGLGAIPAVLKTVVGGFGELQTLVSIMDFSSLAGAGASVGLLAGSVKALGAASVIAAAYAAVLYGAYQIGKWEPISDFFEKMGLRIMGFSSAAADAAIADHKHAVALGEVQEKQEAANKVAEEAKRITDAVKAAIAGATAATDTNTEATDRSRLVMDQTQEELKKYLAGWENLNTLGSNYGDTLDALAPKLKDEVLYYAAIGASVQDLIATHQGLTQAQAQAAVQSIKAAQQIKSVWIDVDSAIAKSHGDNINTWIELEQRKFDIMIEAKRLEGTLTDAALDAEKAKFQAMINSEINSRAEQNNQTRAFYQKEYDTAKNNYDLLVKLGLDASNASVRAAYQEMTEKERLLNHWRQAADDAASGVSSATSGSAGAVQSVSNAIQLLDHSWVTDADIAASTLNGTTVKVRLLGGEIVTLEEAQRRQQMGGSYNLRPLSDNEIKNDLSGYADYATAYKGIQDSVVRATSGFYAAWQTGSAAMIDAAREQLDMFRSLMSYLEQNPNYFGGKAVGGPVKRGQPYRVGENGEELFVPDSDGRIVPHDQMGTSGWGDAGRSVMQDEDIKAAAAASGGGASVKIEAGAITLQYPIMNDSRSIGKLGDVVGDAVLARLSRAGIRVS